MVQFSSTNFGGSEMSQEVSVSIMILGGTSQENIDLTINLIRITAMG